MKQVLLAISLVLAGTNGFAKDAEKIKVVELNVTEKGFEPSSAEVKPGESVTLKITRKTDATCATQVKIPSKKITKELPLNKTITVELGKLEKGDIRFACGMNMLSGTIVVK